MESFSGPGATNARGKAILEANGVVVGADGSVGANAPSLQALFYLRSTQTREQMLRSLKDAMRYAAGVGVTTHLDQGGFPAAGNNTDGAANFDRYRAYDALRVLYAEGSLTNRIWLNFLHLEEDPNTPELRAGCSTCSTTSATTWCASLASASSLPGRSLLPANAAMDQRHASGGAGAMAQREPHSLNIANDWQLIIDGWQAVHERGGRRRPRPASRTCAGSSRTCPFIDDEYMQKLKDLGGGISVVGAWRWLSGDRRPVNSPARRSAPSWRAASRPA